ncbi:MAG: CoA-transferase [Sumerlaeia bacterium]
MTPEERLLIERAAREIEPGMVVNLGIGLPTKIPAVLPAGFDVTFHSENGFAGLGPPLEGGTPDNDVIDAGGRAVTLEPGAACFDSVTSFSLVRGGKVDLAILGAFEVSVAGDLANWMIPGKLTPGMGGGMELAQKARRVLVVSRHLDKHGRGKLVDVCSLPLTAAGCVSTLVTERAVFRREKGGRMRLVSVAPGLSVEDAREGMPEGLEAEGALEAWEGVGRR